MVIYQYLKYRVFNEIFSILKHSKKKKKRRGGLVKIEMSSYYNTPLNVSTFFFRFV